MASTNSRLTPYPKVRVPPSVTYASSETTLAESYPTSPASLRSSRNNPPPYGDGGAPPSYQAETCAGGKSRGQPLPKKTLIIRLFSSIFIAVIVCLIVAAVVGRIHDTQKARDAETAEEQAMDDMNNGTRITMLPEKDADVQTATVAPTQTASAALNSTHSTPIPEQVKIPRPPARQIASYSCPYIHPAKTAAHAGPAPTASDRATCGLLKPLDKEDAPGSSNDGGVLSVSLHSLGDCVIARETYLGSRNEIMYRCGLSCSTQSSDDDDAVSGLEDGWKWHCS